MTGRTVLSQENLPWVWMGPDLPGVRPAPGRHRTYFDFAYASLPAMPSDLEPGWGWLKTLPRAPNPLDAGAETTVLDRFVEAGITLPPEMLAFYTDRDLHAHITSITGCWTDFGAFDVGGGDWLVLFLRDSQDVLFWMVHVPRGGGHRVLVCGPDDLGAWYDEGLEADRIGRLPLSQRDFRVCAGSFREFVYRFAVENALWTSLTAKPQRTLTALERDYVARHPTA
jgi:hypothetical protein